MHQPLAEKATREQLPSQFNWLMNSIFIAPEEETLVTAPLRSGLFMHA